MTQIILVRHGETEYNAGEVFRGRKDVALNEVGRRQAELLGRHFADTHLEAIYSSPLQRALETAAFVANYHRIEVIRSSGLIDLNYGEWEGLTQDQVKDRYPSLYETWLVTPHLVVMPGGEALVNVRRRAVVALDDALAEYRGTILLVSHRVVHKVLVCHMRGLESSEFWKVRVDLGGFTVFEHQGDDFVLVRHNDVSHLTALDSSARADF